MKRVMNLMRGQYLKTLLAFSFLLFALVSQSQNLSKQDSSNFKRDLEKLLAKYGFQNAGYQINIQSNRQSGGQTAFTITNNNYSFPDALIVTQNQFGGENNVNYYQNEYKQLNSDTADIVTYNLGVLLRMYPNLPIISIDVESGNPNGFRIAEYLGQLIQKSNINYLGSKIAQGYTFSESPITIVLMGSVDKKFPFDFMKAIAPYIKGKFVIFEDKGISTPFPILSLYIHGQALFNINGTVRID